MTQRSSMVRALGLSLGACLVVACGAPPSPATPSGGTSGQSSPKPFTPDLKREKQMDQSVGGQRREELKRGVNSQLDGERRQLSDVENKVISAAKVVLGEEAARGQKDAKSFSTNVASLRAAKIPPKVTPNPKLREGFMIADSKDLSVELPKLPKDKQASVRASFDSYNAQVATLSLVADMAAQHQIVTHLYSVGVAAAVVANRKKYGLSPSDEDAEIVKMALDLERRADDLAAATAGLSAAVIATTNGGKPPKALEDMASTVKKSIPSKATATQDDAKTYLDGFEDGLGDARTRYEAMLKTVYGSEWERTGMKGSLDRIFADAEKATTQESDAARRERRRERASTRTTTTGSVAQPAPSQPSDLESIARRALPSDGPIKKAVDVIDSLRKGDAKGAINGALAFVPPGPIKAGLGLIASLFT